jgi:hypothetical protein
MIVGKYEMASVRFISSYLYSNWLTSTLPYLIPSVLAAFLLATRRLDFPKSFPDPSMARFASSVERTFVTCSAPNITGGKIHR